MEKQAMKRPASPRDEEAEGKTLDKDVEEFFTIIRRIRATSRLSGEADSNHRNPSFQLEDSAAFCEGNTASDGVRIGRREGEASEESGVPAWLSLNVGPRDGGRQLLMKRRAGGSNTEAMDCRPAFQADRTDPRDKD